MSVPTTDRGGIQQTIRALRADGWILTHVNNGCGLEVIHGERQAIEEIEATGVAHLYVRRATEDGKIEKGWVFFVLGNDPDEVVNDYTVNLTCVDTLIDRWIA